ncbi:DUF1987 domain-containing protein [Reichenbachiella carrageenanivorans]|uniref:DUF1987 domain-containing protein n=1 Tax=Reichenbachiella carrageenanivorans TaxID=2979869 RepID=A0ABY6D5V5_9BACT|nr:DUF1987 domain-containing protein [Reichenbachiella carrageenanivorans]UXX81229.1 DUF1987 domain-containing protein [Reichenbachiella carrageenanivorans]
MEKFLSTPSHTTPYIYFNPENEILEMKGNSTLINAREVFSELYTALGNFKKSIYPKLKVNIQLEYFNTSTYKCLLDTMICLKEIKSTGKNIVVTWYYNIEDEDALEHGEDIAQLSGMHLDLVGI